MCRNAVLLVSCFAGRITHRMGKSKEICGDVSCESFNENFPPALPTGHWGFLHTSGVVVSSRCRCSQLSFTCCPFMSHMANKAVDRFISITQGITKWLPSNSHRAINKVCVVECRVVGVHSRVTVFAYFFWTLRKIGIFLRFEAIKMAFRVALS